MTPRRSSSISLKIACPALASLGALTTLALAQGTPQQLLQETGPNNSQFGWAVNGLGGDADQDGTPDYLVGAPANTVGGNTPGSLFVMSGTGGVIRQHDGVVNGDRFGSAADGIGDQNADGVPEYAIGAPFGASTAGRIEIRDGASGALIKSFFGLASGDYWGSVIAGLGDLNGDGKGDYAFNGSLPGSIPALYVMSGATNQTLFSPITAPAGTTSFPTSVSSAGDVNADGVPDVAVGASPNALVFSGVNGSLLTTLGGPGVTVQVSALGEPRCVHEEEQRSVLPRALVAGSRGAFGEWRRAFRRDIV